MFQKLSRVNYFQTFFLCFLLFFLFALPAHSATNNLNLSGGVASGSAGYQNGQVKNIPSSSQANGIAVGGGSSLVIKSDGSIWGWGQDNYGQLGDGTNTSSFLTPTQGASGLTGVISIKMNGYYGAATALKSDGTVWSWGSGAEYMLGNYSTTSRNVPGAVLTVDSSQLSGVIAIASGLYTNLALKSDGTVWGWGNGQYGQFCDGLSSGRPMTDQIPISDVVAISAGRGYNMYLKADGTVWSCGGNFGGQLGDGTTTARNTPVQVVGLTGVTAIAAGDNSSIALKSDGTVWAWGYNGEGQLGNGTTINSYTPVQVTGLTGVEKIATGGNQPNSYSLALKSDGTVWSWGNNYYGTLGIGNTTNKSTPQQVLSLSNIVGIAAGEWAEHSLALKSDGTTWAWGYNAYGQLGDGATAQRNSPVQVTGLNLGSTNGTYILNPFNVGSGKIVSLNITEAGGTPYYLFSTDGANWKKISAGSWTSSSLGVSTVGNTKTEVQAITAGKWSALLNGGANLYIGLILPTGSSAVSGITVNTATITSSLTGPTDITITDYAGYTFTVTTDSGGPGSATIDIYYPANNSHLPGAVSAASVTSANGFTTHTFNYGTFINDGIGKHTISISALVVSDLYAGNSMDTMVHSQAPSITNLSCPSSLYAGQPGICPATVSSSTNVANVWTATGGTVTGQGSMTAPLGTILLETPGTGTVTLTSCLSSDPAWCRQASANVQVLDNQIIASFDSGVTTLVAGVPVTVQAQASADYGTLIYDWSTDKATLTNATPGSPNTTARAVTANSSATSVTITLMVSLSSDSNIFRSITLTLPAEQPQLNVTISGPATVLIETPVSYSVTATANTGTPVYSLTLPDSSVVSANSADYTFHQAGNYTISATVFLAEAPAVSVTKTLNVIVHYPVPSISALSCSSSLYVGQQGDCSATVSSYDNMDVVNTWSVKNQDGSTGGTVSNQTGTFSAGATFIPISTSGAKTVKLNSCLAAEPSTCGEAFAIIQALDNQISVTLAPVSYLEAGVPELIQAQAAASYGGLTYSWRAANAVVESDITPTTPNTAAALITAHQGADSAAITLTASLALDPTVAKSVSLSPSVIASVFTFPQGAVITCDSNETVAGSSITCSAPAVNTLSLTPVYKWYVDDVEVSGVSVNAGAIIPMSGGGTGNTKTVKVEASALSNPHLKASLIRTIAIIDLGFTVTAKGYDQSYQILTTPDGSKIYPVKRGQVFSLTISPTAQLTPSGIVMVKDSSVNFTAPGKGLAVSVTVPVDDLMAFEEATLTVTASAAEFPTATKVITSRVKMAPAPLSGVRIASYLPKVIGSQKITLSVDTSDGAAYNPDVHGLLKALFYSGNQVVGSSTYEEDKEYTVQIPLTGRVALIASLAYEDNWASGKTFASSNVFFTSYSNALPTLTVVRKSPDTGYPPYQATFGLAMKGETGNVGAISWEMSKDAGDYAAISGGTPTGLIFTLSDSGSYLLRAVAKHAADGTITATSDPVAFTVSATPDPITDLDFQVTRDSRVGITILFQDDSKASLLTTLPLVTASREIINALTSKWKIYDADSGELLVETPFKVKVSLDLTSYVERQLKIAADLITILSRPVTGEKILNFSDVASVTGAIPKLAMVEKTYSFSLACNVLNGCLSDLSDPLYTTEKIKGWSWTLYKMEGGTEIKVKEGSTQTLAYTDYAGGDFRAAIELTTTSRMISGEKSFNIAWALTAQQKEPIEAAISSASSKAYINRAVSVYLTLGDSKQKASISKVEWLLSPDGGSSFSPLATGSATTASYTPQEAGDLAFKAKIYNKYAPDKVYATEPFTLPVDGLTDLNSATIEITRIDLDKLKYTISNLPLALELKERLAKGSVTVTGQSGKLYASGSFALTGILDARETLNEPLTISFQTTTTLNRRINLQKDFDATIADPYATVISLGSVPFDPIVEFALADWTTLTYGARVKGINYYLVKKYDGTVKLYAGDDVIATDPMPNGPRCSLARKVKRAFP